MSTVSLPGPFSLSRQRLFLLGLLAVFVGLSVQYSVKALSGDSKSAFLRWREQILHMDGGEDIYLQYNYPNPPIMALILSPLAHLPALVGALSWFYLKVALTLLAMHWVFLLIEPTDRPFPPWAKALTVLLSLRPITGDLLHGNVNLFILFLVIAAIYAFHCRHDLTTGVLVGLAIACKVTPALFIPYFLWKRAWGALIGCFVGLALFLWMVPSCFLGWEDNAHKLRSWTDNMIIPFVVKGQVTSEHPNQSLPGVVYRLATHSPSFSTYVKDSAQQDVYTPVDYHNVLDLDPWLVRWLLKGCMILFAALVVWSCRTPTAARQGWRLAAEFSIVLLGMLLFSERTWKHHCVTLLLPFAVLCYYLAACRPSRALRSYLIGTLAAVALLMASTSTSLPGWRDSAKLAQVYGAYAWACLLLLAALVALLRRRDGDERTPNPAAVTEHLRISPA